MRVTLRDIAKEAKVSVMTVSLAMRDQGRISEETRERIKTIAKRLRYTPDPALSALVYHRRERTKVKAHAPLAFMTNFATEEGWRDEVYVNRYFEGAGARAQELGYTVENFWLRSPHMTRDRLCRIFETRGVQGLLVAPVDQGAPEVDFAWERFCSVSLCRNLVWPKINVVDHNHHHSIKLAWHTLMDRDYRRVGLAIRKISVAISDHEWLSSHRMQQEIWANRLPSATIPPFVTDDWSPEAFWEWLRVEKPDVVVSPHVEVLGWLLSTGLAVPEKIGFLHLEARRDSATSGIQQNFFKVGVAAVDLLHLEIMRKEMGVPAIRQSISIDGTWHEGNTLRPAPEGRDCHRSP